MEGVVAIIMVFSIPIVGALAFSPIGKALGERLRGKHGRELPREELDDIREHLQSIQEQLSELAERQDFTERVIAQVKEKGAIGGGAAS